MREILFRGKRITDGEWIQGFYVGCYDPSLQVYPMITTGKSNWLGSLNMYAVDNDTIGQYTGLKDKNGKKIFEGDIVGIKNDCGMISSFGLVEFEVAKVVYNEKCLCWHAVFGDGGDAALFEYDDPKRIEVIGNIHDTPDFL